MPSEGAIDGFRKLGFFVIMLDLEESAQDFGRNSHSYSHLLVAVVKRRRQTNITVLSMHEVYDQATASDKLLATLVIMMGHFGSHAFRTLLSRAVEPLSFPSSGLWPHDVTPAERFWSYVEDLLPSGKPTLLIPKDETDAFNAIDALKPTFLSVMRNLSVAKQAWVLHFALPHSFVRHTLIGDTPQKTVVAPKWTCDTDKIPCFLKLSKLIGNTSAAMSLNFSRDSAKPAWATFTLSFGWKQRQESWQGKRPR
jgi:hypothetical protein